MVSLIIFNVQFILCDYGLNVVNVQDKLILKPYLLNYEPFCDHFFIRNKNSSPTYR